MGIRGGSVLVPWRPFFWNAAEVVARKAWLGAKSNKNMADTEAMLERMGAIERRNAELEAENGRLRTATPVSKRGV